MPKVLLHNMDVSFVRHKIGRLLFDQIAVFFAEPGDIVVTRASIPPAYLAFLERVGCVKPGVIFFHQRKPSESEAVGAIFEDEDLLERVRAEVRRRLGPWVLDSFAFTGLEAKWAAKAGIAVESDPAHFHYFGSKSVFRSLAKQYNLAIPAGFEYQKDALEVAYCIPRLFGHGFRRVVIKQDEGILGIGQRIITVGEFVKHIFRFSRLAISDIAPVCFSNFVVEGYYENVVGSPSVQFYIQPDGTAKLDSVHRQMIIRNDFDHGGVKYQIAGNAGSASHQFVPEPLRQKLVAEATAFVDVLAEKGLRGHLGLDAIVLSSGEILWTELNPRKVSPHYALQIARRAWKWPIPPCYIASVMKKTRWEGKTVESVLEELAPLLFTPQSRKGIIPYAYNLLESNGRITILSLAGTTKEAFALSRRIFES